MIAGKQPSLQSSKKLLAPKYKTVLDTLHYEYAKLIADAAIAGRSDRSPADRRGNRYWPFVTRTYAKLAAGEIKPSKILRENKLLATSGPKCAYCGSATDLHWEHIIPRSRGGPDTIDNQVLACSPCNLSKGAKNPLEWYEKRGLRSSQIPRLVMGKLLKVVLEEHTRRGTLYAKEFPPGQRLRLSQSVLVFDFP